MRALLAMRPLIRWLMLTHDTEHLQAIRAVYG